jgi:hypothetical protein
MLSMIKGRVIGRHDNIVLVDFSREPHPPAPRFPGAGGLRERGYDELKMSVAPLAVADPRAEARA